jgi:hypothetical protein
MSDRQTAEHVAHLTDQPLFRGPVSSVDRRFTCATGRRMGPKSKGSQAHFQRFAVIGLGLAPVLMVSAVLFVD